MTAKNHYDCSPELIEQPNESLQTAYKALNSKNPLELEVLTGTDSLAAFIGTSETIAVELIKNGRITAYDNGRGETCFLLKKVVNLINEDPEINRISWKSYVTKGHTDAESIIFFRKWKFEDRILIKYLFQKRTYYAILKPGLWRKNKKIGSALIRLINQTFKSAKK